MLLSVLMKRSWDKIRMWREISRQRSELRRLSEFLSKDIGISRAEAEREADRPFWDYDREVSSVLPRNEKPADCSESKSQNCCLHA